MTTESCATTATYGYVVFSEQFTGKERDAETGLDYFGARYFSGAQGRFTSPDWSATPQPVPYADLTDPQTLNLYSYVRNNPLIKADPDGHCGLIGPDPCSFKEFVSSLPDRVVGGLKGESNLFLGTRFQPSNAEQAETMRTVAEDGPTIVSYAAVVAPGPKGGPKGGKFSSKDPLVGNLANEIETAYPGHVEGVNVPVRGPNGQIVTDADIVTGNSIIQVKSGNGKGLSGQVERTENATGTVTIGYGPELRGSVVKEMQSKGQLVTKDKETLIRAIKPDQH